jgi:hypothetical protein
MYGEIREHTDKNSLLEKWPNSVSWGSLYGERIVYVEPYVVYDGYLRWGGSSGKGGLVDGGCMI